MTQDKKRRKETPMATGLLDYFPDALAAVANVSYVGNEQHNPGQPMHWAKEKSRDHADCIIRHLSERGRVDTDGLLHSAKVAWRALALLQIELESKNRPYSEGDQEVTQPGIPYFEFDVQSNTLRAASTSDPHRPAPVAKQPLIYLAGPMRGYPEWNKPAFERCAANLRALGWTVWSPIESDQAHGAVLGSTPSQDFMRAVTRRDIEALTQADAIYLMKGWENSAGCLAEHAVAVSIGLEVQFE